ncbi:EamA family transporter [Parapedobacter sp. SGR-10]|uniref:EamA family transporter n=1 Tax=Parapedobacter sp. SGR-10 TaxID=2710879 RepID=UPI0013D100E9|nr:DMT family transporter [Parapedobacter sp. SGR-10]NGF58186.1 EamA family transporter [Parapedobacter sp. SGR-10]
MERFRGAIAVFIGAASFGILSTFVKLAYAENFTLGEVTGVQVLFGTIILWSLYGLYAFKNKEAYPKKTNKIKILLTGISTGAVSILYYKCVELVPASIAIVLLMQFIWISALIDLVVFKQKPSKKQFWGIAGILLATLLATGVFEASIKTINPWGIVYGMLAAMAYAIFIIVNGKVGNDYPPIQKSALMVTGACIFVFTVLQPAELIFLESDSRIMYYGLLLSLFGTVLPPLLFAYGIPKIGISLGSILSAVELPVAVLMSYTILSEPVSLLQWVGVVGILAVVVWINKSRKGKLSN